MQKLFSWIKSNTLSAVIILIFFMLIVLPPILIGGLIIGTLGKSMLSTKLYGSKYSTSSTGRLDSLNTFESATGRMDSSLTIPSPGRNAAPTPEIEDRMKVKKASISLHVNDVRETVNSIGEYVDKIGGYVVTQRVNTPKESSSGTMQVRVPTDELEPTLEYLRERSVNVVYESVSGRDITDQYVDTQAKLDTLNRTKEIFEGILEEAEDFDEILRAQKEILNIQRQIDNVRGQINYMEGTSETALITINLSTDAIELGYAPPNAWRPSVVFKRAVRSLIKNLRGLGNFAIWLGVYSVIWLPILIGFILLIKLIVRKLRKMLGEETTDTKKSKKSKKSKK